MPHPIDVHIGNRLRARRRELSLSQEALAEMVGVTFQQIQKYERGANRISGSRMWHLAKAMSIPISYYYEGLEETADGKVSTNLDTEFHAAGGRDLAKDFVTLPVSHRHIVSNLARTLVEDARKVRT